MEDKKDGLDTKTKEKKPIENTENDPWIGDFLFKQYEVKKKIGKGAFGDIYLCVTGDGEEFAAKVVIIFI